MNIQKRIRITPLLIVAMLLASLLPSPAAHAANNIIFVTPTSGTVQVGQSITVQVKGNIATDTFYGADLVSGTLQFPANLLKVTNVSTAGATLNWQVSATPGNGVVNFSERAFNSVNNTAIHIMAVTFQAIAPGNPNLSFNGATRISSTSFGTNYPTGLTGGSYSIPTPPPTSCPSGQVGTPPNCTTPPPAKCPTGQVGTPPNCTTPAPAKCPAGQTGTPPNCKTPTPSTPSGGSNTSNSPPPPATPVAETPAEPIPAPQENGLSISDASTTREYKTATLSWKTSSAAKNTVTYGTSLTKLDKTAEVTKEPDESYSAKFIDLTPGKRYYFTINSESEKDASKTSTYSGVFTTKGFPVAVTVTEGGNVASGAKLKISEQTYSTDKSGKINFELATGSYSVEVTTNKSSKKFTLAVAEKTIPDGKSPETQSFIFDVPLAAESTTNSLSPIVLLGIGVGAIAVLGLLGGMFVAWRRRKAQNAAVAAGGVDSDYTWSTQQPLPVFPQDQQSLANYQGADTGALPMEMPYAAPPDSLPPQEIMPPDQAAAMAIQDLPPPPEDMGLSVPVPSDSPSLTTATPIDAPDINGGTPDMEIGAPYQEEPQTMQQTEMTESLVDTGVSNQPQYAEYTETPAESPPAEQIATSDDEQLDIQNTPQEKSTDEPGLTNTPPTTESGKGELQIDHHANEESSESSQTDVDSQYKDPNSSR